ncbi:MAG: type II secretion system-associated lipoprotein [Leptospiraceae bacterium]|nr:type II secretion system-associated lipoprotein [Leptospiraceae bacterium]MCP5497814.1 type II secretion system-associated lipoprotein [Leptospiraceae bacterium]
MSTLFIAHCSSRLIKKKDLPAYNKYYKDKIYYLKEDLIVTKDDVLKKGTPVKIWIESTETLLKVKCYPISEKRESAIGRLVIYAINNNYKGKKFTRKNLDKLIEKKLSKSN